MGTRHDWQADGLPQTGVLSLEEGRNWRVWVHPGYQRGRRWASFATTTKRQVGIDSAERL